MEVHRNLGMEQVDTVKYESSESRQLIHFPTSKMILVPYRHGSEERLKITTAYDFKNHVTLSCKRYILNSFILTKLTCWNWAWTHVPLCLLGLKAVVSALIHLALPYCQETSCKPWRGSVRVKLNPSWRFNPTRPLMLMNDLCLFWLLCGSDFLGSPHGP